MSNHPLDSAGMTFNVHPSVHINSYGKIFMSKPEALVCCLATSIVDVTLNFIGYDLQ
jgi:hypothetical protein